MGKVGTPNHPMKVLGYLTGFFLYYIIGVAYYATVEGWNYTDCIYFITVSVCTVGYGQFVPSTDNSRIFTVFYIVPGIVFVFTLAKAFAKHTLVRLQNRVLDCLYGENGWRPRAKIFFSIFCIGLILLIGILSFAELEKWTAAMAFYWTVCTMTTVGYGDLKIQNESTRQFGIFFIFLCVLTFATAIDNIQNAGLEGSEDEEGLVSGKSSSADAMISGKDSIPASIPGNGESDFIIAQLIRTKVLKRSDVDNARKAYKSGDFDDCVIEMSSM